MPDLRFVCTAPRCFSGSAMDTDVLTTVLKALSILIVAERVVPHPVTWTGLCVTPLLVVGNGFRSAAGLPAAFEAQLSQPPEAVVSISKV